MYGRNWQRISQHYHNIYTINVYSCELREVFLTKCRWLQKVDLKGMNSF